MQEIELCCQRPDLVTAPDSQSIPAYAQPVLQILCGSYDRLCQRGRGIPRRPRNSAAVTTSALLRGQSGERCAHAVFHNERPAGA